MKHSTVMELVLGRIKEDVKYLKRFVPNQVIQRGYWDGIPAAVRKRIIALGYVRLTANVVYLTVDGLEVVGYRETA